MTKQACSVPLCVSMADPGNPAGLCIVHQRHRAVLEAQARDERGWMPVRGEVRRPKLVPVDEWLIRSPMLFPHRPAGNMHR